MQILAIAALAADAGFVACIVLDECRPGSVDLVGSLFAIAVGALSIILGIVVLCS